MTYGCYLDDSNGATITCRALMQALARGGFIVEALSGPVLDLWISGDSGEFASSIESAGEPKLVWNRCPTLG